MIKNIMEDKPKEKVVSLLLKISNHYDFNIKDFNNMLNKGLNKEIEDLLNEDYKLMEKYRNINNEFFKYVDMIKNESNYAEEKFLEDKTLKSISIDNKLKRKENIKNILGNKIKLSETIEEKTIKNNCFKANEETEKIFSKCSY